MKKLLLLLFIILGLGAYFHSDKYGIEIGGFSWSPAPEKRVLLQKMKRFLEDIQFKDFDHAADFHSEQDKEGKDISKLIEEKFLVKPEQLDIKSFEILTIDIMSTGDRAKIRTRCHVVLLNPKKRDRDIDAVFYWKLQDGRWYLDLQSSL